MIQRPKAHWGKEGLRFPGAKMNCEAYAHQVEAHGDDAGKLRFRAHRSGSAACDQDAED